MDPPMLRVLLATGAHARIPRCGGAENRPPQYIRDPPSSGDSARNSIPPSTTHITGATNQ